MIKFRCPECHAALDADEAMAGREVRCAGCFAELTVPVPSPAPAPGAAPDRESENGRPAPGPLPRALPRRAPARGGPRRPPRPPARRFPGRAVIVAVVGLGL